jgi:hypothetical protein
MQGTDLGEPIWTATVWLPASSTLPRAKTPTSPSHMDFRLLLCSLCRLLSRSAAVVVFEKERVKGFEPPFEAWCEAGTSTLARGGAGVRSREAGAACASRGFALHRGLHGLAAVGGSGCPGSAGSGDAGDLICPANFVGARTPARVRSSRLGGAPTSDGLACPPVLQNVTVQSGPVAGRRGKSIGFVIRAVMLGQPEFGELPVSSQAAALAVRGPFKTWVSKMVLGPTLFTRAHSAGRADSVGLHRE